MSINSDMNEAIIALADATRNHHAAAIRTAQARKDETDALNRLNAAQRRIDELMATLKKTAPRDSEWTPRVGTRVE